nr:serine--tRNA ligase [Patescibacteria group bacterium]
MLDIKYIRDNTDLVKANTKNRKIDVDIDRMLMLDEQFRALETKIEELRFERNVASKTKPTPGIIERMKKVGDEVKLLEDEQLPLHEELKALLMQIPNLTHIDVKVSDDEDDNPVVEAFSKPTKFDFEVLDHVQLAQKLDLIEFDKATKVSGAKFYYLKNELALMEFALIGYALDILMKYGFIPFTTPDLAKREVLEGLGFNPRGESTQVYNIEGTDLSLIGTAEITLGGYHADEILDELELPKKYAAVSHCFRTEAGSYSKYSKGIFRVHQFTKIEMFVYCTPENAEGFHKELLNIEKEIFKGLDIPFRVVDHCTADLGGPSYRTFDLEAWMPGKPNKDGVMGDWAEITSTSNCTDYQARGLNMKYKTKDGKKDYLYTLNGTAIAITRAMIAILENYQQVDGTVLIPEVLHKFMPVKKIEVKVKK